MPKIMSFSKKLTASSTPQRQDEENRQREAERRDRSHPRAAAWLPVPLLSGKT